jgi:ribosome assembly protein YihI (activator of Der GTPase)
VKIRSGNNSTPRPAKNEPNISQQQKQRTDPKIISFSLSKSKLLELDFAVTKISKTISKKFPIENSLRKWKQGDPLNTSSA